MKAYSALYCTETKQMIDAKTNGVAVRSPRAPNELEFWFDSGVWTCLLFNESLYRDIPEVLVPDVVLLARTLLQ